MKTPQCTTTPQCYRELARVMEQFGFDSVYDTVNNGCIKVDGRTFYGDNTPAFDCPEYWEFAVAKIEGKPVFVGDTVYDKDTGIEYVVIEVANFGLVVNVPERTGSLRGHSNKLLSELTLTKPVLKQTILIKVGDNEPVEVEKAECIERGMGAYGSYFYHSTAEASVKFRKALAPLVKE